MSWWVIRVMLILSSFALTAPVHGQTSTEKPIPADTCVVDIAAPAGTKVVVDGSPYGDKRRLTFQSLEPNRRYGIQIVPQFPDGTESTRRVYIVGARRQLVTFAVADSRNPHLVLQVGPDSSQQRDLEFSPDGETMLASYPGERIILWDVKRQIQLRQYVVPAAVSLQGGGLGWRRNFVRQF